MLAWLRRCWLALVFAAAVAAAPCLSGCGEPDFEKHAELQEGEDVAIPDEHPGDEPEQKDQTGSEGSAEEVTLITSLYPRESGATWVLRETVGDEVHKIVIRCLGEKKQEGQSLFFYEIERDGQAALTEGYTQDAKGIHRTSAGQEGGGTIDPPMTMLALPLQPGLVRQWSGSISEGTASSVAEATLKLSGPEPVTTPAGSYRAYRLDQEFNLGEKGVGGKVSTQQWLAPGVGLVRQDTFDGEVRSSAVLERYRPGRTERASEETDAKPKP